MIPFIPTSHSSRKNRPKPFSDWEVQQNIRECELQYGEICYKCEKYIGDATGYPRVCNECPKDEPKPKKSFWEKLFG